MYVTNLHLKSKNIVFKLLGFQLSCGRSSIHESVRCFEREGILAAQVKVFRYMAIGHWLHLKGFEVET